MELEEAPISRTVVKLVFLRKPDADLKKKGIRSYRATALTSVMSKWYAACISLRLVIEKRTPRVAAAARGWY